jgi:hypothetical protein
MQGCSVHGLHSHSLGSFLRIASKGCVHDYVYRLEKGIFIIQSQIKMYLSVSVVYH